MKGLILWVAVFVFAYLAITAVDMGEYAIAAVLGVMCLVVLWAAPSGATKTKKAKKGAESASWW